jgi:uracil-DNA glycosylase
MFTDWHSFIDNERQQPYFVALCTFLESERAQYNILPPQEEIFAAFDACPYDITKVIIVGQDPYHGLGQAHGLAFSVNAAIAIPPSLRNIFREREADLSLPTPAHGNLTSWAQQGILLLNSVLTVREAEAHSHRNQGWETFTDHVISYLNTYKNSCVFVLWGSHAQKKTPLIDATRHHIVTAPHPSPLSAHRGFLGSRPYSNINNYLTSTGQRAIDWKLPSDPR